MANASLTWLGHASFRIDSPNGKRIYIDPWVSGPTCPAEEKEPERVDIIAVTHGHGDHVGDVAALGKKHKPRLVAIHELAGWLDGQGYPDAAGGGMGKGGTVGRRRHQVHADERVPLELDAGRQLRRRARRRGHRARERLHALPRRRHVRLRRHAADRAHLRARPRHPPDRRPLHDGPARGRRRPGAARRQALCPVSLGNVPVPDGTPAQVRELAPDVEIVDIEPGQTIEL